LLPLVVAEAAVQLGISASEQAVRVEMSMCKRFDIMLPTLHARALCRLANWNGSTLLYGPGANGSMLAIDIVAAAAVLIITALLVREQ
jgi:hypothetical protein